MHRIHFALLAAALTVAPAAHASPDLDAVVARYQTILDATDPDRTPAWPDLSPEAAHARDTALAALQPRLSTLSPLSGQEAITRDVLQWRIATEREGVTFDEERAPFLNGDGFFTVPTYVAGRTVLATPEDARRWNARLAALPRYFAQATGNMQRGIATGFTQPAIVVDSVTAMLRRTNAIPLAADPLLKPYATRPPGIPQGEWNTLKAEATATLTTQIRPAQVALLTFLERDYYPHARPGLGAGTLPGGQAYYAYTVRRHTTTGMTPDQVFALGEAEVRRIRAEMEQAKLATGYTGDLKSFLAAVRADKRYYASDLQTYVEKASEIAKRADYQLPRFFGTLPRLTYGVIVKPPEIEGSSNGYIEGDPEKGVAGQVSVNRNATRDPLFALPAWVLHEGVPGHHLQIARAQELADLPRFRRGSDITAFVEGWGLYTETLGFEMGIYRTPMERFGKYSFEIWRACRLMMDVGLHARGWSFDRAANCLRENTALPEEFVRYETLRYVGWPGQALAYKVGEQDMLRLRRKAERELGPRFDLRAFHDVLLGAGALPLSVLDRRIDGWIASQPRSASIAR